MIHDHTGRAAMERDELYALADEAEELGEEITVPVSLAGLPDLVTASQELTALNGLVNDLADHVMHRTALGSPGPERGMVVQGCTAAAEHAGQAVANFTRAYSHLGQLHHRAETLPAANTNATFRLLRHHLETARENLDSVALELRTAADTIGRPLSQVSAALSRSTQPLPPARPPTPGHPGHLGLPPTPVGTRHAR
ncbi:hypothetical protein [Streptomyces yaizuensis]|uniref:Uncharacterized protein n=1 Tax=Streptomyces yaizuensis TaxID=2989713 RepID=A0ABQ5NYW3_9ACTN|nr:hypothetical protein [Streptomyces sp. YSPA8]GLF95553.1 hypothetical protein SYYSPA8_14670 [Streptomyces sp. YSPA8]